MSGRRETYSILSSVRICVRCHPSVSVTIILLYVLQGFTPILLTLSSGAVIDASIRLLGSQDYRPLFSSLSVLLLAPADCSTYKILSPYRGTYFTIKLQICRGSRHMGFD